MTDERRAILDVLLAEYRYWAEAEWPAGADAGGDTGDMEIIQLGAVGALANVIAAVQCGVRAPWHPPVPTNEEPMSHVATVEIEVRDLDALDEACRRVGLELVRGQQTYRWYGKHVGDYPLPAGFAEADLGRCEHAVRIPGGDAAADAEGDEPPYEIGVVRRRDGRPGYVLHWDFFAGGYGLEKVAGPACGLLKQAYATVVAKRQAMRQGFTVTEQRQPNGHVRLLCRK